MSWFFVPLIEAGVLPLAAVLLVLLSAACEIGFRAGHWRGSKKTLTKEEVDTTTTLTAGMLALLAFILGFTIDFAQQRFEVRRDTVAEEAKAISTAWRRAQMEEGPDGAAIVADVAAFARNQLEFTGAKYTAPLSKLVETSHELETDAWSHAISIARAKPNPISANLAASLNTMFDAGLAERIAFKTEVPTDMLAMLFWGSLVAIGAMGFQMGLAGARQPILSTLLLLMWTGGMVVTVDLNRPRVGSINVNVAPLEWVVDEIAAERPPAARIASEPQ